MGKVMRKFERLKDLLFYGSAAGLVVGVLAIGANFPEIYDYLDWRRENVFGFERAGDDSFRGKLKREIQALSAYFDKDLENKAEEEINRKDGEREIRIGNVYDI